MFVGRFPDRVIVGLLHSNTFNGDLQRYPFAFEKFGVTQIRQTLNGEEYPYRTLQLTGDQAYEDLLGYDRFLQAMGAYNEDKIPMLQPSDWGQDNNCTLFMFNMAVPAVIPTGEPNIMPCRTEQSRNSIKPRSPNAWRCSEQATR